MARNTDRRAQGNTARLSGQDPSARLGNGFASQSEPTSRAARTHPRTPRPRRPTPQRGSNPGPRPPAAVRDFHALATIPPGCNGLEDRWRSPARRQRSGPVLFAARVRSARVTVTDRRLPSCVARMWHALIYSAPRKRVHLATVSPRSLRQWRLACFLCACHDGGSLASVRPCPKIVSTFRLQ
jgi:hypothetical protein